MSIIDYRTLDFKAASEVLEGKNIVFTGRGFLVRSELMRLARQAGANVESVVTKKCDILIVGEKPGSKLRKAKILGCEIITTNDFKEILECKRKNKENFIDEDILKIAVCDLSGINNSKEHFFSRWKGQASIAVSGELYLDFMESSVSKGKAMRQLQEYFGLSRDECMAFGDNYNDIDMLNSVTYSYVMETAADDIKKHGKYVTDWVEGSLRENFKSII